MRAGKIWTLRSVSTGWVQSSAGMGDESGIINGCKERKKKRRGLLKIEDSKRLGLDKKVRSTRCPYQRQDYN